MQISEFRVEGLFKSLHHRISLETRPDEGAAEATVTIIHGANGVGKTTMLHMLDGMMRLDFDVFRRVPFSKGILQFSTGHSLSVAADPSQPSRYLEVTFGERTVQLHPSHSGPLNDKQSKLVEEFRTEFFEVTRGISFELVSAMRQADDTPWWRGDEEGHPYEEIVAPNGERRLRPRARRRPRRANLAERVERFIANAQVDYRQFFSSNEPDLFPRIMARLAEKDTPTYSADELRNRLAELRSAASDSEGLGLEVEPWSYDELVAFLDEPEDPRGRNHALTVLDTYAEFLEAAAERRQLLAQRLRTFERILADFYTGKRVTVNSQAGLNIQTLTGDSLTERQLSSGEYHLLYLMVTALVSKRRGAVIAIDEPEMSMHIAWQRKLIPNLVACASHASPQLLFATHSPELVAEFRDHLVEMKGDV